MTVREWMLAEKDSYIKETGSKEEAIEYLCMDANSECKTSLSKEELLVIAKEVVGVESLLEKRALQSLIARKS